MTAAGQLLVFEGPDGVGKTTLSQAVARSLAADGHPCRWLSFPGREPGTVGSVVYDLHHRPERFEVKRMTPASLQALHVATHLDTIESIILPALANDEILILDRYWWSTWVYGLTQGVEMSLLKALITAEKIAWGRTLPAAIFYVTRSSRNSIEDTHDKLQSQYAGLMEAEISVQPIHVIANDGSVEQAVQMILQNLKATFRNAQ